MHANKNAGVIHSNDRDALCHINKNLETWSFSRGKVEFSPFGNFMVHHVIAKNQHLKGEWIQIVGRGVILVSLSDHLSEQLQAFGAFLVT